jgi:hypothetical protein
VREEEKKKERKKERKKEKGRGDDIFCDISEALRRGAVDLVH